MTANSRTLAHELSSVTDQWRELDPVADAALAVDGLMPRLWCEPGTPDELANVLKLASSSGAAVIPRGGGTRMVLGMPPRAADILLSTRRLERIVEYEPADLTVTVEAGVVLAELQRTLAAEGQLLALDPPGSAAATIGGVVATNASGPLRLQYGAARDLVIGTRVANADGVLTRAGGRVVKNVAGYDLNKLYTGSLGTLGVIVELSFKLHPQPRSRGTLVAAFPDTQQAAQVVAAIVRSPLGPTAIEVLDAGSAALVGGLPEVPAGGCLLLVLVGGFEKAVARVLDDVGKLCLEHCGQPEAQPDDAQRLWDAVRELPDASSDDRVVLKLALPPARSVEGFDQLRQSLAEYQSVSLCARAGVGVVYARIDAAEWDDTRLARLAETIRSLRSFAAQREGSLVVECSPTGLKQYLDVWGEIGQSLGLMRALKERLDPAGTLNPGRFVGGI